MTDARTFTAGVATLLVVFSMVATPAAAAPWDDPEVDQAERYGTPSWIVTVEAGELDTLESWAEGSDSRTVLRTNNDSNTAVVTASADAGDPGFIARVLGSGLKSRSYVVDVQPNYEHSLAEPVRIENLSDTYEPSRLTRTAASVGSSFDASWSRSGIAAADTTNRSTVGDTHGVLGVDNVSQTGAGTTGAVIDTGCNVADGRVFGNGTAGSDLRLLDASKDFVENETVARNGTSAVEDPNGHGTYVASEVLANTSEDHFDGAAPDASLLCLRALDESGQGSTSDIADAVRYAADHDADAIVMSLGSPVYDAELVDALEYAVDQNVSAIAIAAGNSRQTTRWVTSPADAPTEGVTAVSATNTTTNESAGVAPFANVGEDPGTSDLSAGATAGEDVDVAAPGIKVTAKVVTTSGSVTNETLTGTSMAAPHVGGIALLGVEADASWTGDAAAFREAVRDTARPIPNAAEIEVGAGQPDAERLLANETDGDQSEAMDDEARGRDAFWTGLGDTTSPFGFDVPLQTVVG